MSLTKRQDRQERNYLINSAKDFSQRSIAAENLSAAYDILALDRHIHKTTGSFNGTPTIQRATDSPTALTKYCSEFSADFAAASSELSEAQTIESINSRELTGEVVSKSIWIKSASCTTIRLDISTADVEDDFIAVTSIHSSSKTIVADETWQLVEFENISMTAGVERGILVEITLTDSDSTGATEIHRITRGKLNIGSVAQDWSYAGRDYEDEFKKCKRYYEKSYNLDDAPGTITNDGYVAHTYPAGSINGQSTSFRYERKRVIPTLVTYSPTLSTPNFVLSNDGSANRPSLIIESGEAAAFVTYTPTINSRVIQFHWTADAEMAI